MGVSGAQVLTEGLLPRPAPAVSPPCSRQHPGSFRCQLKDTRVLLDTPLSLNRYILFASKSLGFNLQKPIPSTTTPGQPSGSTSPWTLSCSSSSCLYPWPSPAMATSPRISARNPLTMLHPTQEAPQSFYDPEACRVGPLHLPDHPVPGAVSS